MSTIFNYFLAETAETNTAEAKADFTDNFISINFIIKYKFRTMGM